MIAEQGGQISDMAKEMALMKKMLEEAGIKPVPEDVAVVKAETNCLPHTLICTMIGHEPELYEAMCIQVVYGIFE